MNQHEMMHQIMALDFSMIDLCLYLDTHPSDSEALELFNDYKKECRDLKAKYEENYGPLTMGTTNTECWNWIENPWPWEHMFD